MAQPPAAVRRLAATSPSPPLFPGPHTSRMRELGGATSAAAHAQLRPASS